MIWIIKPGVRGIISKMKIHKNVLPISVGSVSSLLTYQPRQQARAKGIVHEI